MTQNSLKKVSAEKEIFPFKFSPRSKHRKLKICYLATILKRWKNIYIYIFYLIMVVFSV